MSDSSSHPFLEARARWVEDFAHLIIAKRNWQLICFIQAIMIILLISGLIMLSRTSHIVPYVVEVDQLGRALAVNEVVPSKLENPAVMKAHLYRFVELWRSVVTDPHAMRQQLQQVYRLAIPDIRTHILDDYYRQYNAMELASQLSRQVIPISFLQQSDQTYLVEWKEIDRDLSSKIIRENHYKALLNVQRTEQQTKQELKSDPHNPFGIFIAGLSWSEVN